MSPAAFIMVVGSVALAPSALAQSDARKEARLAMVKTQIEGRGIKDAKVLESLRNTPRHEFVPKAIEPHAYEDRALPIGEGQTISQPYIVGLMTELLELRPEHRVLEVGTGSGYQAAVLSPLVRTVYSIEIVPELHQRANEAFRKLGYRNIVTKLGDGYAGWKEQSPFDRVILTAAPVEIPQALIDQLKPGGRMVAPVGRQDRQELIVLEKQADGAIRRRTVIPVAFVPMVPGRN